MGQGNASIPRDPNTGFPLLPAVVESVSRSLAKRDYVGVLLIDASPLARIERETGHKVYDEVLRHIGEAIEEIRGTHLREEDRIAAVAPYGEQFVVFLDDKRGPGSLKRTDMESLADRVYLKLSGKVFDIAYGLSTEIPRVGIGYSFAIGNSLLRPSRVVMRMLDEARRMSRSQVQRFGVKNREKLKDVLLNEEITTMFQPIVSMKGDGVLGYEALSRGPKGTEFEQPLVLFALAEEADLMFELDRVCRRTAIRNARGLPTKSALFVNTLPSSIHDPQFRGKSLKQALGDSKLVPSRLVVEITEHLALESFDTLRKTLDQFRELGVAIAVDDVGTGHANLESILKLKPNYIKIDISLVRGVDESALKRELLRALCALADQIDAELIAEGIETDAEAQAIQELGVRFGQGFLYARPGPPWPSVIGGPLLPAIAARGGGRAKKADVAAAQKLLDRART
jgi:EAL domain-containing protein (putative c-di-GMP-specific phosphodiesterase class I)/GGDEF domain-containing protein